MGSAGASPAVPGALAGTFGPREASFRKHASATTDVFGGAPKTAGEGARAPQRNPSHRRKMKKRPWLWIVFGYAAFIAGITTAVVIAIKNKDPEVPLKHGP